MQNHTQPDKQVAKDLIESRAREHWEPPPSLEEIRRQLGWDKTSAKQAVDYDR